MKYCVHCGQPIEETATVCMNCGCAVKRAQTESHIDVLCLLGLIFSFFSGFLGLIISLVAYHGVNDDENQKSNQTMAKIGIIVSLIKVVFTVIVAVLVVFYPILLVCIGLINGIGL